MVKFEVRSGKGSMTRLIAGVMLLVVFLLVSFHSKAWVMLAGLMGVMHVLSAVFGFCPMELFLNRVLGLPVKGQD